MTYSEEYEAIFAEETPLENQQFGEDESTQEEPQQDAEQTEGLENQQDDGEQKGAGQQEQSEAEQKEQTENEQETLEEVTLNYLGKQETLRLTKAQKDEMLQKGRDYDRQRQRADEMAPAFHLIKKAAAGCGMELEQYLQYAQQQMDAAEIAQQMQSGVPEETAKELLMLRRKSAQMQQMQQQVMQETQNRQAAEQQRRQGFQQLLTQVPEIGQLVAQGKGLPQEVVQGIARGETPLAAYRSYEAQQAKQELAALRAAQKNEQTAPGSVNGLAKKQKADAFESGFDSAFS